MIETYVNPPAAVPETTCENCGNTTRSQMYRLYQIRENVERTWDFCGVSCIRKWTKPAR